MGLAQLAQEAKTQDSCIYFWGKTANPLTHMHLKESPFTEGHSGQTLLTI